MTSGQLTIEANDVTTKALLTTENGNVLVNCESFRAESLTGVAKITAHTLGIANYWANKDSIDIKCKKIDGVLGV